MTELILTEQETGEETLIQMGPHHPSTHGVINFLLRSQGELVRLATPNVGYLHRGIEKLAEITPYAGFLPYTDRVDYLAAMFANQGFAMAVEALTGIVPPRRAEYLRVIATELNRIASHLIAVGSMAMDMGAFTPFVHGLREREVINDLIERLCGARLTYHYVRIGGVARDLDAALARDLLAFCDRFERFLPEYDRLISGNEIFVKRLANVGVISDADAISYGLAGPNLRASGVDYDLRRDAPYGAYPELALTVPVGRGTRGTVGDCYDRFVVRIDEMAASVRLVRQALQGLPEGDHTADVPRRLKPPPGEVYARVESARGELGYFVVSNGSEQPERVKIRCGSFTSLSIVEHVSPGLMLGDLVALIASLDVVAPEIDR